ncbi:MAG: hypothetical protein P1U63_06755 [Coxiellaceae bacterium]|nr:hypothetical protein [Coxiellaceae bacterium]
MSRAAGKDEHIKHVTQHHTEQRVTSDLLSKSMQSIFEQQPTSIRRNQGCLDLSALDTKRHDTIPRNDGCLDLVALGNSG